MRGSTVGLGLPIVDGHILNFQTTEIWIHGNTHSGSGSQPDGNDAEARPLGALLMALYAPALTAVDTIVYDGIGELVDPEVAGNNTNLNHVCAQQPAGASWATLDLPKLQGILDMGGFPTLADLYRPAAPFAPFDCTGFTAGPIAPVMLPF